MNFEYAAEKDRKFLVALIFSVVIHIILLCNWPFYRNIFLEKIKPNDIEVTYIKAREEPVARQPEARVRRSELLPELSAPQKLVSVEVPKPPQEKKSEAVMPKKEAAASPTQKKAAAEQQVSKVVIKQPVVPKVEAKTSVDASLDAQGMRLIPPSYSQVVRDRIIGNLDTRRAGGEGDVYVRFVITSSGALKEVNIVNEKSTDDGVLREAAFTAVKNSAPFPVFPEKVEVPEIVFTCQITFARK